jgi:hypothetical protein
MTLTNSGTIGGGQGGLGLSGGAGGAGVRNASGPTIGSLRIDPLPSPKSEQEKFGTARTC